MQDEKSSVVLVCVTNQKDCARLIDAGDRISKQIENSKVCVFSVQPSKAGKKGNGAELEYLRQKAKSISADMTVIFDDRASYATADYAKSAGAVHIVTGMAGTPEGGFIETLHELVPDVIISMVSKEGLIHSIYPKDKCPYEEPIRKI